VKLVFGPRSGVYAQGLTGIDDAVVTDAESLPYAYAAAVRCREAGAPFYGMLLYEDRHARVLLQNAAGVASQVPDIDLRLAMIELLCSGDLKIGDGHARDLWPEPEAGLIPVAGEFFALCDAMLVRSYAEFQRLAPLLKRPRRVEPVLVEPVIPAFARSKPARPSVVVWAPGRPSVQVVLHALALTEFLGEVTYVTSDGAVLPGYNGRFVRAGTDLPEILERACCVLCVEPDDPGAAVAFARRGVGVVAPLTSGAHELVRDVVTFDMRKFPSLFTAVQIAIAQPASVRAVPAPLPAPARPALPPRDTLPLVSVIVPTYNRREDLARALTCLQAQTYPRLDVLVVNDAGVDVADVVTRFPVARLHTMAANAGVLRVVTEGMGLIDGEFVQLLADDDWLNPDHIEGLVGALLRTGGTIAHCNTLIRYQDLVPGREPVTTGFNAVTFNESTTPTDALITTPIAGNALLFRRDMFDAIGPWRDDCILADQELQLRAANRFVMVYVDRMTAEWRARGSDNFSTNTDSSIELRRVYEELHPTPDRPHLLARRAATLENVAGREKGVFTFPPTITITPNTVDAG
jgi:GT2 family glycosyltransferase